MPNLKSGYTPSIDAKRTVNGYEVKRQYVVEILSNETSDDMELNIINTSGLPEIGEQLSIDYPSVLCDSLSCSPADNGNDDGDFLTWYVEASFKTPTDSNGGDGAVNPLDEAPVISFGATQYDRVVDKAYDSDDTEGNPTLPVENTVKDPFDPPIIVPKSNQYITIQQNISFFNPSWIVEYENTINLSSITIAGVGVSPSQARMMSIRGNNAIDSIGREYWVVSYEIEVSQEGFNKKILNSGLNFKKQGVGKLAIKYKDIPDFIPSGDDDGEDFINEPQKLLESGAIAGDDDDPFYKEFKVYFSKSWSSLSIPSSS